METMLSYDTLGNAIKEIFEGCFDRLTLINVPEMRESIHDVINANASSIHPGIDMFGQKGDIRIAYFFDLREWTRYFELNLAYHQLENLKGNCVRQFERIELERKPTKQSGR